MSRGNGWFFLLASIFSILGLIAVTTYGYQKVIVKETPQIVNRGHDVWRRNGCEGCHTLFGQGGQFGSDLTHVYSQRTENYIREFMVQPAAFYPQSRVMPRFALRQDEVTALIAMFRWVDQEKEALQQWPPVPMSIVGDVDGLALPTVPRNLRTPVLRGRLIFEQRCASCHSTEPDVVLIGPSLWEIGTTALERDPDVSPSEYIRTSIVNPSERIVDGFQDLMQKNFGELLGSEEIDDLVIYLLSLSDEQSGD